MTVVTLFVYGTLRHDPVLERLLGRRPPARPAVLPEHRVARLVDRPYPGLVPTPGTVAIGELIDVDERELGVLDRFEGAAYDRVGVEVHPTDDVGPVVAEAWRLQEAHRSWVLAADWVLEDFVVAEAEAFLAGSRPGATHPGGPG